MNVKTKLKNWWFNITHDENKLYKVSLDKINIQPAFKKTPIGREKWLRKLEYYKRHKKFESQIILDENFVLLDGYSSYCVARRMSVPYVWVKFVKEEEK